MNFRSLRSQSLCFILAVSALAPQSYAYELKSQEYKKSTDPNIAALQTISNGVAAISDKAEKALVFVSVAKNVPSLPPGMIDPFEFFFGPGFRQNAPRQQRPQRKQEGLGSGFIVDLDKGYIVTNNHVIDGADEITIKVSSGKKYDAKVVGRDQQTDVAVVQVTEKMDKSGLGELSFGDSKQLRVGDFVVALGAPFGLEASVSFGVVSALGRGNLSITNLGNFIQTDAAINPGNSGGPLLNTAGQVIGINTAIFSKSGGYNGIGFAVPSNLARKIANQLINTGTVSRGYLGVYFRPVDDELIKDYGLKKDTKGVFVANVEVDSPADKAGLEPGDIIIKIGNKKITSQNELQNAIALVDPGSKVKISYLRDGKEKSASATLSSRNLTKVATKKTENQDYADFGMVLKPVSKDLSREFNLVARKGAVITAIKPGSAAAAANLLPGDVIIRVNRNRVSSPDEFKKFANKKSRIIVRIDREGTHLYASLRR